MAELITYTVQDKDGVPVSGAILQVYSAVDPYPLVTEGVTAVNGQLTLLLPDGAYDLRLYMLSYKFPVTHMTVSATGPQSVQITGEKLLAGADPNPRICVATGCLLTSNMVSTFKTLDLIPTFDYAVIDGHAVSPSRISVRADAHGTISVRLIRNAVYNAIIDGDTHNPRAVFVPDVPLVSIGDLLFPRVSRIVYAGCENNVVTVPVGSSVVLTPTITASSGLVLPGTASGDVSWAMDGDVAAYERTKTTITVTGLKIGTTELRASRIDKTVVHIPDTPITNGVLTIIVV